MKRTCSLFGFCRETVLNLSFWIRLQHKHGTTNVVIVVQGELILAIDSRVASFLLGLESHEWVNKVRCFTRSNLFMTLCGDRWTAMALYNFLNRVLNTL